MVLGVPGATAGVDLVDKLIGTDPAARGIETTESAAGMLRFKTRLFESAPRREDPEPSPSPSPSQSEVPSVSEIVSSAAAEFGVSYDYLMSIAQCESNYYIYAYNPAGYHGLFQFDFPTWSAYGYGSIYDPEAQARTAARLIAAGQTERWPNCA